MRTKNAKRNIITSVLSTIITIIIGFIAQTIFIKTLGTEYLGLNSLFSNILSMFSLVELGIGSAIVYSLYKPLAENNEKEVKGLLNFYKLSYNLIALVIFILSLCILPFIPSIVDEINIENSLYVIFILFSLNSVCSYLLAYKRSILYADQKSSILTNVHLIITIVLNVLQISFLILTSNYIVYLIIKIISSITENVIINKIVIKNYPYIKNNNETIDKETKTNLLVKVKGLIFHKVASVVVTGTDNILLSMFIGITYVGLYSNYYLIVSSVSNMLAQIFNSLVASIGNLLVKKDANKSFEIYKKTNFINLILAVICTSCLIILLQPFISIWIGYVYWLDFYIVIAICFSFYLTTMRRGINAFKEAAGIFHEDRFVPLVEALINLVSSLIFIYFFGMIGVFLGTITSTLLLFLYSYPKYVYTKLFERKYSEYVISFIKQTLLMIVIVSFTYYISIFNVLSNVYLSFTLNGLIAVVVPLVLLIIIYRKTDEYMYYKKLLLVVINKKRK